MRACLSHTEGSLQSRGMSRACFSSVSELHEVLNSVLCSGTILSSLKELSSYSLIMFMNCRVLKGNAPSPPIQDIIVIIFLGGK